MLLAQKRFTEKSFGTSVLGGAYSIRCRLLSSPNPASQIQRDPTQRTKSCLNLSDPCKTSSAKTNLTTPTTGHCRSCYHNYNHQCCTPETQSSSNCTTQPWPPITHVSRRPYSQTPNPKTPGCDLWSSMGGRQAAPKSSFTSEGSHCVWDRAQRYRLNTWNDHCSF